MNTKRTNKWISIVGVVLVLAVGILGVQLLMTFKKVPERVEKVDTGALVEVINPQPSKGNTHVQVTGTADASDKVSISPQVSGVVIQDHIELGKFFKKADLLFRIDPADYLFLIASAKAQVKKAEFDLAETQSRAKMAKLEWKTISGSSDRKASALLFYEPQLAYAKSQLQAVKAALDKAKLDLARTKVTAPFNCRILSETIGVGQLLSPGAPVVTVVATDAVDIVVPILARDLSWLEITGKNKSTLPAAIQFFAGNKTYRWNGKVVRMLASADTDSRMIQLLIRVQDPYNRTGSMPQDQIPLMPGMFVNITLNGSAVEKSWVIASSALKDNNTIWVIKENKLDIRKVTVLRKEKGFYYVKADLLPDTKLVTTNIAGAAQGMPLRLMEDRHVKKEKGTDKGQSS